MPLNDVNQRLNGLNPLAYIGVNSYQPPEFVTDNRPPTQYDIKNFFLGTIWLDTTSNPPTSVNIWMLVSIEGGIATWVNFSGASGFINTLTGNSGGVVPPTGNNINVVGDGTTIDIVGNPGTSTLTASVTQNFASTYTTDDAHFATPVAYNLNIFGAGGITTSSSGNTVTITGGGGSGTVTGLEGDNGNIATPTAGIINIAGGLNITTAATAGPDTVAISVSGTTDHEVQIGNATGSLSSITNGTTGQVLTAQTGADPIWATPTSGGSSSSMVTVSYTQINGGPIITWAEMNAAAFSIPQSNNQTIAPAAGLLQNLYVNIATNTSTTNTRVTFNVNGVNTPLFVTIPALTTGVFSNTVDQVSFNQGDLIQFEAGPSVGGTTVGNISADFVEAGGGSGGITGLRGDNLDIATATGGIINIAGGLNITTAATAGPDTVAISVSGTTDHEVQIGNATGSLSSITNGTTGQVLTAQTGADPIWSPSVAGALVWIQTQQASGVANLDFTTGITSTYNNYLLLIDSANCPTASSEELYIQISTNGGATWITTGYGGGSLIGLETGQLTLTNGSSYVSASITINNATRGIGYIFTSGTNCTWSGFSATSSNPANGVYTVASTVANAFRITVDGTKPFSGYFSLYGYVH